jgi:hypothetical protein
MVEESWQLSKLRYTEAATLYFRVSKSGLRSFVLLRAVYVHTGAEEQASGGFGPAVAAAALQLPGASIPGAVAAAHVA